MWNKWKTNVKNKLRSWLDVPNYDIEIQDLYGRIDHLESIIETTTEISVQPTSHVVDAKGIATYSPEQKGNVVIAEPKIMTVERGKR